MELLMVNLIFYSCKLLLQTQAFIELTTEFIVVFVFLFHS